MPWEQTEPGPVPAGPAPPHGATSAQPGGVGSTTLVAPRGGGTEACDDELEGIHSGAKL